MSDKELERGYGSDTDIDVLDRADENTPEVKPQDVPAVGGYGMQTEQGVARDPGGSATAQARAQKQPTSGSNPAPGAGFTGASGGVAGSGVDTTGLAVRGGVSDEQSAGQFVPGDGGKPGVSARDLPR
jgi:hypothetical protein